MSRYLVKTKYTYEKRRQTDYTYAPDNWTPSGNREEGRFIFHRGQPLCTLTLRRGGAPVEQMLSPEQGEAFGQVSGFLLSGEEIGRASSRGDGSRPMARVTLWGGEGESFCTIGRVTEAPTLFSTRGMTFVPVRMTLELRDEEGVDTEVLLSLSYGYVLNTLGEVGGQAHFYELQGGTLSERGGTLVLGLRGGTARLLSPVFPDSSDTVYNMVMPLRNTVFMVMTNHSTAQNATLSWMTGTHPWEEGATVTLPLAQDGEPHAYYFNLSRSPEFCDGRLRQLALSVEGEGELLLHRYSFEQEKPVREEGCEVLSLTADPLEQTITFRGRLLGGEALATYGGGRLRLYTTTMADETDTPSGKRPVGECPIPEGGVGEVTIERIPLRDEYTTRLPYQFALFAEAEGLPPLWLCDRFYIQNYEDFDKSPYPFELPDRIYSVTDFGAKGDALTNDTQAIQAAIDAAAQAGGGRVVLPGSKDRYGRRYVVTNLLLRSYTELHLEQGAVLWQSQLKEDYDYEVTYGHDGVIPGINWTHNLHVSNLPLLQAANIHHFKVTGQGTIRMMDTGSVEGVGMPGYATGCPDRIHCIPLGFFHVEHCECKDFEIIRANNYHTSFNHSKYVYVGNVRLHEVKCVSGDGFGVGGSQKVFVNRCFFQSNDDGIVMSTHYTDPRGILWWTNLEGEDNSCRDITTAHSYINSGGGKALAFITWGTSDPIQEREEIDGVLAYDNFLTSVNPVGAWADNPYAGKQPFDNSETDDYSPVKNLRILGNRYVGNCTLGPIAATNVLTDCGVHSTSQFRNGDFTLGGMANWTYFSNGEPGCIGTVIYANKEKGRITRFEAGEVAAAQGLHLLAGQHTVTAELLTGVEGATLFISRIQTGEILGEQTFRCPRPTKVSLTFTLSPQVAEEQDVFIGFRSVGADPEGFAIFDACELTSVVDEEGLMARRREVFLEGLRRDFLIDEGVIPFLENGKVLVRLTADKGSYRLPVRGEREGFSIEAAIRTEHCDLTRNRVNYGYRFSLRDDGRSYRELRFLVEQQVLELVDVVNGEETPLYHRDHFFFTSLDFHIFRLEVEPTCLSLWIDGSQYAVVDCPLIPGGVEFHLTDARLSLNGLRVE